MGTMMTMSVTGFVGGEVTVRQVGEQRVASFSVAVSRKNRAGEKQTLWVRVNCWNRLADIAQQYVKKGSLIQATSEWLRPSAWVDQSGTPQPSSTWMPTASCCSTVLTAAMVSTSPSRTRPIFPSSAAQPAAVLSLT